MASGSVAGIPATTGISPPAAMMFWSAGVTSQARNAAAQTIVAQGGLIPVVAGTPATEPLANAMLDFAANQGYTRYPMIDNVTQPEVTDVANKVLDAVLAGTTSPQDAAKAMADALNQLPPDRRGDTYTAPAPGG